MSKVNVLLVKSILTRNNDRMFPTALFFNFVHEHLPAKVLIIYEDLILKVAGK